MVEVFLCTELVAQNSMRIHQTDGTHLDVPIEKIENIIFVDADSTSVVEVGLSDIITTHLIEKVWKIEE